MHTKAFTLYRVRDQIAHKIPFCFSSFLALRDSIESISRKLVLSQSDQVHSAYHSLAMSSSQGLNMQ